MLTCRFCLLSVPLAGEDQSQEWPPALLLAAQVAGITHKGKKERKKESVRV